MELIDVVMKLVGPVDPIGETHTDDKRFDNLIVLRELTRELLDRIESVAETSGGHMASVKVAKDCAASFLADVRGEQARVIRDEPVAVDLSAEMHATLYVLHPDGSLSPAHVSGAMAAPAPSINEEK